MKGLALSEDWQGARLRLVRGFAVKTNTELSEGRGREYVFAYARNHDAAKAIGKGKYVMGTDCPVVPATFVEIKAEDGSTFFIHADHIQPEDLLAHEEAAKREAALAKLTPEDRKVLGLT